VGEAPAFEVEAVGRTDVGQRRDHNEDSFLVDGGLGLYIVADGMGGHAGGGTASRLAVETIQTSVRKAREKEPGLFGAPTGVEESPLPDVLREAVEAACTRIFETAQGDPELAGMGTTVTAALLDGRTAFIAHVGDSRCYLLRGGRIYQVSEDHSLVNEQLKAGAISVDEAKHSRFKNIITRSVGFEQQVQVDLLGVELEPNDVLLLCCDGLSNLVDDAEILQVVGESPLDETPSRLIEVANERGGDDNITVVLVRVQEPTSASRPPGEPVAPT